MPKYVVKYWVEKNDEPTDLEKPIEAKSKYKALMEFLRLGIYFRKIDMVYKCKSSDFKSKIRSLTDPDKIRLSEDKRIISKSFEVYFADLHLDTDNIETKEFIERANVKVQNLKNELLTELNEL